MPHSDFAIKQVGDAAQPHWMATSLQRKVNRTSKILAATAAANHLKALEAAIFDTAALRLIERRWALATVRGLLVAVARFFWLPSAATGTTLRPWVFTATDSNLEGFGDLGTSGSFGAAKGSAFETRGFAEFYLGDIQFGAGERLASATWRIDVCSVISSGPGLPGTPPSEIAVRGFVDSPTPHVAADFQRGAILATIGTPGLLVGDVLSFDVTGFLTQAIVQSNTWATLGIQALTPGAVDFMLQGGHPYPRLDLVAVVPEAASLCL